MSKTFSMVAVHRPSRPPCTILVVAAHHFAGGYAPWGAVSVHFQADVRTSTIFCSQFEPIGWLGKFPEATIADAALDRIVHDSYTIEIRSADQENQISMREVYGLPK